MHQDFGKSNTHRKSPFRRLVKLRGETSWVETRHVARSFSQRCSVARRLSSVMPGLITATVWPTLSMTSTTLSTFRVPDNTVNEAPWFKACSAVTRRVSNLCDRRPTSVWNCKPAKGLSEGGMCTVGSSGARVYSARRPAGWTFSTRCCLLKLLRRSSTASSIKNLSRRGTNSFTTSSLPKALSITGNAAPLVPMVTTAQTAASTHLTSVALLNNSSRIASISDS
mmetsp:Transcript_39072/g.93757  ORF Transcript_39072/g.93757 Transcript_39072/m.93757 type:complete len:225 (-) Transcript_39072:681-1355(-)